MGQRGRFLLSHCGMELRDLTTAKGSFSLAFFSCYLKCLILLTIGI
jgi:hypothetical protein